MNIKITLPLLAATALLLGSSSMGFAQSPSSQTAPGERMQERDSVPGQPGASSYAPDQEMQQRGSKSGEPGASGYAAGPNTTGAGSNREDATGSSREHTSPSRNMMEDD